MDKKIALLIILFLVIPKHSYSFTIFTEKIVKIYRFEGQCAGLENIPITFHNLSFQHIRRTMVIGGEMVVTHDLNNEIEEFSFLTRCRNREALDSCETYNKIRIAKCCDLVKIKGQIWSPFVDSIKPRIRCPVKTGSYILENATAGANFDLFPAKGWYWKINVRSFDTITKELLLCMNIEAEILTVRKKND